MGRRVSGGMTEVGKFLPVVRFEEQLWGEVSL